MGWIKGYLIEVGMFLGLRWEMSRLRVASITDAANLFNQTKEHIALQRTEPYSHLDQTKVQTAKPQICIETEYMGHFP